MDKTARFSWILISGLFLFSISSAKPQAQAKGTSRNGPQKSIQQKPKPISSSLERPSSFATLLQDEDAFLVLKDKLPATCAQTLQDFYKSGKSLHSQTLYDASEPVLEVNTSTGTKDLSFFHWTNSRGRAALGKLFHEELEDRELAHKISTQEKAYDQVFKYLRADPKREKNYHTPEARSLWASQWYFAEDSSSSRTYGQHLIEIEVSEQARVLRDTHPAWENTIAELTEKYPDVVQACELRYPPRNSESYGCGRSQVSIYFLIAEDSNIDFINYYGCGSSRYGSFFQLISPQNIRQVKLRN